MNFCSDGVTGRSRGRKDVNVSKWPPALIMVTTSTVSWIRVTHFHPDLTSTIRPSVHAAAAGSVCCKLNYEVQ